MWCHSHQFSLLNRKSSFCPTCTENTHWDSSCISANVWKYVQLPQLCVLALAFSCSQMKGCIPVVKHWNRLPRDVVKSWSVQETCKCGTKEHSLVGNICGSYGKTLAKHLGTDVGGGHGVGHRCVSCSMGYGDSQPQGTDSVTVRNGRTNVVWNGN